MAETNVGIRDGFLSEKLYLGLFICIEIQLSVGKLSTVTLNIIMNILTVFLVIVL